MWLVPLSALTLFPSFEFHQLALSPYVADAQPGPTPIPGISAPIRGLELSYRHLSGNDDAETDQLKGMLSGSSETLMARVSIDDEGIIQLDQLRADAMLASLRVRRNLGDMLDLSLIGGHWENSWGVVDRANFRLTAISPSNLTLVGLSNTDQDDDAKLKYYISIGGGIGGEFIARFLGPVGVYGRFVGKATTQNRHRPDAKNTVRNEVSVDPALGLALIGDKGTLLLSGWGDLTTQWETRDADGRTGIDRQYIAWGLRLTGRLDPGGESGLELDSDRDEARDAL